MKKQKGKKGKKGRLFNEQVSNKYHFSFPLLSSFPPFQNKNTLQNKKKNKNPNNVFLLNLKLAYFFPLMEGGLGVRFFSKVPLSEVGRNQSRVCPKRKTLHPSPFSQRNIVGKSPSVPFFFFSFFFSCVDIFGEECDKS